MTDEERKRIFTKQKEKAVRGVKLSNGVKIRLMSKEDLDILRSQPFFLPPNISELISPRMFALEKHIKSEKGSGFDFHKAMQNIILSMRLMKGGIVFGSYVFCILLSGKRHVTSWSYEEDHPRTSYRKYVLNFEEVPLLRKNLKKIQSIDFTKRRSMDLACRRFQRAYEEKDTEDQLIDLMIAFEALFLKGERKIPVKGKVIAIACSTLLGKSEEEREEIKRTLIEAYSIRNCIVHGSEYSRSESDEKGEVYMDPLPDLVSEVEDYLRESIKKLLD